jgi:hypothetical protein
MIMNGAAAMFQCYWSSAITVSAPYSRLLSSTFTASLLSHVTGYIFTCSVVDRPCTVVSVFRESIGYISCVCIWHQYPVMAAVEVAVVQEKTPCTSAVNMFCGVVMCVFIINDIKIFIINSSSKDGR